MKYAESVQKLTTCTCILNCKIPHSNTVWQQTEKSLL